MGTDILFENHTIKEIQEIEKKLRNDIERKKEELRQMVGERYRDLMDAADTITEMKDIAESVTGSVKSIEGSCTKLQGASKQNGILSTIQAEVERKKKSNELLYTVASQVKILMDSPTKIWTSIQNKDFVSAVSLYLLAQYTHSRLVFDPVHCEQNISSLFPVIHCQWIAIDNIKQLLLENCQTVLKDLTTEPEDAVGPLCCSCLLFNISLQQVLTDFLELRKSVLRSIFHPERNAKPQICEYVTIVQMTLKIIYALLYPHEKTGIDNGYKTNLLYQKLVKLISNEGPGAISLLDLHSSGTFKFLPRAITEFRPILTVPPEMCDVEFLQSKCKEWLNDIKESFQTELRNLLNFVKSVQSLALIRESVYDKLCEVEHWDKICDNLLNQKFSIWDSFLKECFWKRIKSIINDEVQLASEYCQKDVEETLYKIGLETDNSALKFEKNISLYVWMESTDDVMENIAWIPRHHRNYWNSGELSMKAMGFTPKVQSISKDLDRRLQLVLDDISYFSVLQNDTFDKERKLHPFAQIMLSEVSKDADDVYRHLMQAAEKHLFDLSSFMETTLLCLEKEGNSPENGNRIVFLGHICYSIANLCPHINMSLSSDKLCEFVRKCPRKESKPNFTTAVFKETELWKDLKKKLLGICASAFRLWSNSQIQIVLESIQTQWMTSCAEGLLKALLQWDKIEIQEESEQGNAVNSVLRIPQHISVPVSNALFAFCQKLNTVGGYSISSEVRSAISKQLLLGLLNIYKGQMEVISESFNTRVLQVQSLQLLFDVQFLTGLLVHKDNACEVISGTSQDIINKCVSRIDPFDMDVFSTPLQQNIKKALQKSLSLFGLLTSPDQVSYLNSIKSISVGSPMDHNVMLMCSTGSRFPLLPLSTRSSREDAPQEQFLSLTKEKEVKSLPSHSSSPNLSASDIPTNTLKSATSFYDKLTANFWFGN